MRMERMREGGPDMVLVTSRQRASKAFVETGQKGALCERQ